MALDASALYAECRLALARARACVDERNAYVAAHGHDDISEPAGRRPRRRTRALGAVLPRRTATAGTKLPGAAKPHGVAGPALKGWRRGQRLMRLLPRAN